ncbi:MAG: tetratricopeptide repeat protein [Planctomycetes bacterium]|nr:tetratricopeptide repeat protein [Planctomycetota bacterium]
MILSLTLSVLGLFSPAVQDTPAALVEQGRTLLSQNRAADALALFEQADALEKHAIGAHMWVLRCQLQLGRINDTLDEIDKLAKTEKGPEIDYLYGMGFWFTAKDRLAQNAGGAVIGMNFADAVNFLKKATAADGKRYFDAWLPLAESAWYAQDLPVARDAAEKATAAEPKDAPSYQMLGQIAFSQYIALREDEAQKDAAQAHIAAARAAFEKADALLAPSAEVADRMARAQAQKQLGDIASWMKDKQAVSEAYGRALGLDPNVAKLDQLYPQIAGSFDKEYGEVFLKTMETAEKTFVSTWGAENAGDATLLWWLGWARMDQKQFDTAETAFAGAVKKWPQYVNSWFYIGICRYSRQDFKGAVTAILQHDSLDRDDLVRTLQGNARYYLAIFDKLVGTCAESGAIENAARLSEVQGLAGAGLAANEDSRYWNNAGLFWRDAGDALRKSDKESDQKLMREHYETALVDYEKALALEPEHPNYLNDTAVMLHYCLDRDPERAKELYKKAAERAAALLEKKGLSTADRELYQVALRDSKNNLAKLEKGIKTQG